MLGNMGVHVLRCPTGVWTFAGTIPVALCDIVPASAAALLWQRAYLDGAGNAVEARRRLFETEAEAREFAAEARPLGRLGSVSVRSRVPARAPPLPPARFLP